MNQRRVVVTGMGIISPIGSGIEAFWSGLAAGRSGIGPITRFDPTGYTTTFAGEVRDFEPEATIGRKEARRMDRYVQFAVASALAAREMAGLTDAAIDPTRIGAIVATAMGGMETFEQGTETVLNQGPSRLGPFFVPMMLSNMGAGQVAIAVGAKGPNFSTVSACAAAGHALGEAMWMIRSGRADVIYAGGSEAPVTRMGVAGFNAMGALSTRNDSPAAASRPFDKERDGFVLAEGGAMLVLEERDHALKRGATILGEITGYATTDDANHIVQPGPGGEGAARAMVLALADAGLTPADIDYINAHGTSTQLNEQLETLAIKRAFGDLAGTKAISSTKSMTGHLLGAAGAIEASACLLAIREQCAPPTINYQTPDPECDLDVVPNVARPMAITHTLSNSMGFGGHNVALVISAHRD